MAPSKRAAEPPVAPSDVGAVIVTFHPDLQHLRKLAQALGQQAAAVVVVDNTPGGASLAESLTGVHLIRCGMNVGLAEALNRGIDLLRAEGFRFFALFDQDSMPADDMLRSLADAWVEASRAGLRVGAAGPAFSDERGGQPPSFLSLRLTGVREAPPIPGQLWVETAVLITSGSLVSDAALAQAGLMDSSLFIDSVDIEWGFRARAHGWTLIGAPGAVLHHQLGDDHVQAPACVRVLTRRTHLIRHSPVRLYYIMRNRVLLLKMPHVPLLWKLHELARIPVKITASWSVAADRGEAFRAMRQGVRDGLRGVRGAKPAA